MQWARARGRYREWIVFRDAYYGSWDRVSKAVRKVRDVLFLGEPEDSVVRSAAAWLGQVADGTVSALPAPDDPTPEASNLARARCWTALWNMVYGDARGATGALTHLREQAPLPYRWSVCAGLIEVYLAELEGGDVRSAVIDLDSIVRPVPMGGP